jgi:Asp-tRNA(Asn)/Glu-tRNA(Gln) amidotransferase A subunit family amidase
VGPRAARDAAAVGRLRAAGAILLGKTNCPEFLTCYESDNHLTGRTNNPWNLERTAGGSSGGEAAAIASFCSAGGMGSDGGGSIRVPAHFCGIAGLKPTPGRISSVGHFPAMTHPLGLLGVAGPMARSAADLRLLFDALAGYDPQDPFAAPVRAASTDLGGLRVGLWEQFYNTPVQPEIREAVRRAARALEELRVPVEPFQPDGLERAPNLWWFFFGRLAAPAVRRFVEGREEELHWTAAEFLANAAAEPEPSSGETIAALAARDAMRAALLRQMESARVLLAAPCGITAFPHRARRFAAGEREIGLFQAMMPATPVNLLGLPAVVIPFGVSSDGLPIGIQLIGRPWEEETLLELAARLEEWRGPFPAPPGY